MIKASKILIVQFLIVLTPLISFSQVPDGGILLNRETGTTYQQIGNCIVTEVSVSEQEFTTAIKVEVGASVSNAWDAIVKFPSVNGVEENDVILVAFWARTTSSLEETGEGSLNVIIEQNETWTKQLTANINIGGEWKEYYARTQIVSPLTSSELNMIFHMGFPSQTIELARVRYLNYKNSLALEDLPETGITYMGQAPDAAWRAPAEDRIINIRKGGANIKVLDASGVPLEGAQIHIEMGKHQFGFGTAIAAHEFNTNATYRNTVLENFNEVVFENDLKWPQVNSSTYDRVNLTLDTLDAHGIPARGHNIIWPSFRFSPDIVEDLKDDPEALRSVIDKRINEIVSFTNGRLNDWDVINEPFSEHDIQDILGDEVMADWFKRTRRIDRGVKLYLNDYAILSGAGNNIVKQDYYYGLVQDIEAWGGEIDGIGMQGHFGTDLTSIPKVYSIVERFAGLDKDIKITEFDISTSQREVQADYTRDFMTILFSHASVKSIMVWGFWANRHWKPESAFYEGDWTIRPHGEVWNELIKNQWWTPAQDLVSDANGDLAIEGFLGEYNYTLSFGGDLRSGTFSLDNSFQSGLENTIILYLDEFIPEELEIIPSKLGYLCLGETLTLQASGGDSLNYSWQRNGEDFGEQKRSILVSDSGSYTVTIRKNNISKTSPPYIVELRLAPERELLSDGGPEICNGEIISLSINDGEFLETEWFRNDLRAQWGDTALSVFNPGTYKVELTGNGCSAFSESLEVEVNPFPEASVILQGESSFCSGGSAIINALVQTGAIYNWYRGEELLDETGTSLTVSEPGTYSLVCSKDGCSATSAGVEITLLSVTDPECTVGIGENQLETRIFPNPFQGSFQVDLPYPSAEKSTLELYNASGKLVHVVQAEAGTSRVTFSVETPGLYTLRISRGEEIQSHKLIHQ